MKIALAQLNYKVGDFKGNKSKIIAAIETAKKKEADIVIFSELAITGYMPSDLLLNEKFINNALTSIKEISEKCTNIAAIVGCPSINKELEHNRLFNTAWFLRKGKILPFAHKTLLNNHSVFEDNRYFYQNQQFNLLSFKGMYIGITIGADLFDDQPFDNQSNIIRQNSVSPIKELSKLYPDFIVNISALPFSHDLHKYHKNIVCNNAVSYNLPIFFVNHVGANSELIFDGGSMIVNAKGNIFQRMKLFEEDLLVFNTKDLNKETIEKPDGETKEIMLIYNALVLGIRDYFKKSGLSKALIGLSGGIDSAVVAALAVKALGKDNVHGILLPSQYSSKHSITDAVSLAVNLGINHNIIHIEDTYKTVENALSPIFSGIETDVTEENIQARIRGMILMAYSNKFGYILLNTSNKSEVAVGYGTLYGDMCGALSILGDVYKSGVYKLANFINSEREVIPYNTISKPPSAELRPGQKDSDSLPEYIILDTILFNYLEQNKSFEEIVALGFDSIVVKDILKKLFQNEFKRFQSAPVLRVSSKGFGIDRKMPLVSQFGFN
ncbi:MAG: NAD+ synthase [Marinilabiliaceae bacterium]|nr:NAD+ synthase [Marinilabiliaceae bacterium]